MCTTNHTLTRSLILACVGLRKQDELYAQSDRRLQWEAEFQWALRALIDRSRDGRFAQHRTSALGRQDAHAEPESL